MSMSACISLTVLTRSSWKQKKFQKKIQKIFFSKIFFVQSKYFLFPEVSKSESITPAKFHLDRVKTVRDMKALIPIWPLPEAIPQKLRKIFFRPIKKIFVSGFKWG